MKIKEYMRLGKISIKARKKSTRNTVTGICFGLIMLIPVLFFSLSFYIGLTGEINKTQTVATFHLPSRTVYDTDAKIIENENNSWNSFSILDYKSAKNLANDKNVEEYVASEFLEIAGMESNNKEDSLSIKVSDGDRAEMYALKPTENNMNQGYLHYNRCNPALLKIIHMPENGKYIFDAEKADFKKAYGGSIFKIGDGFTKDTLGKTEIILSENFCSKFVTNVNNAEKAMSPADIIGKKISFSFTTGQFISADQIAYYLLNPGEVIDVQGGGTIKKVNYIQDFVVKGIIDSNYYKLPGSSGEAHVWISSKSVYDNEYKSISPTLTLIAPEGGNNNNGEDRPKFKASFNSSIAQNEAMAKASGRMVLAYGALQLSNYETNSADITQKFSYMTAEKNVCKPILDNKIQCNNYNSAQKLSKKVDATLVEIMPSQEGNTVYYYTNSLFSTFSMVNMVGGYIMIILFAFGGIIFFATMLNLYNSVNYSVQVRKNYMGVMRAIGAKSSMIPKLYFWEIVLIFLRALPWVLIFSGGLSFGIKALIDLGFKYIGEALGMFISLNFVYFFVALGIVVVVVFLIALVFSQIASAYAARRPILTVLSDDKG